jgi:hypothetical protein
VSAEGRQSERGGEDKQDERHSTPAAPTPSLDALEHRDLHQAGESTPLVGRFRLGAGRRPPTGFSLLRKVARMGDVIVSKVRRERGKPL